jgi:hypothetical protein
LEFVVAILGTIACIEKVISITDILQTGEKNRFLFEAIKAGTRRQTILYFGLKNLRLLREIPSPQKYETSTQQEKPTALTLAGNV